MSLHWTHPLIRVLLCVPLLVVGCDSTSAPEVQDNGDASFNPSELDQSTADSRAPCAIDAVDLASYTRNFDVEWAYRSLRVPGGFGGLWLETKEVRFYLVDLNRATEAADSMRRVLGELRSDLASSTIKPVKGAYDWLELFGCYGVVGRSGIWNVPQMVSTDIQEKWNRIVIGASTEPARQAVRNILRGTNVPERMVVVIHQDPVFAY